MSRTGFQQERVESYSNSITLSFKNDEVVDIFVGPPGKQTHLRLPKGKSFRAVPFFEHIHTKNPTKNPTASEISLPDNDPTAFSLLVDWIAKHRDSPPTISSMGGNVLQFYKLSATLHLHDLQDQIMDIYVSSLAHKREYPSLETLERGWRLGGAEMCKLMVHFLRWMIEQKHRDLPTTFKMDELEAILVRNYGLEERLRGAVLEYKGQDPRWMHKCEFYHHDIFIKSECRLNLNKEERGAKPVKEKTTKVRDFLDKIHLLGLGKLWDEFFGVNLRSCHEKYGITGGLVDMLVLDTCCSLPSSLTKFAYERRCSRGKALDLENELY